MRSNFITTLSLLASISFGQVQLGAGSYATQLPQGRTAPSVYDAYFSNPNGVLPTNDWWSSLGFRFLQHNTHSEPMFPHPLTVKAEAIGLGVGVGNSPNIVNGIQFQAPYDPQLFIKLEGLNAPNTTVEKYTDWSVTAKWNDGTREMTAQFAHGSPYVYCETSNNAVARMSFTSTDLVVVHNDGNALCIQKDGNYYGLFAPTGKNWTQYANDFAANLGSNTYFSVALLPDGSRTTFDLFKNHAFVFVDNTVFSWNYDEQNAEVSGTFTFTTDVKEGNESEILTTLFPHQWKYTNANLRNESYTSLRGEMKLFEGNSFSLQYPSLPMLPYIENIDISNTNEVYNLVDREYQTLVNQGGFNRLDTYWHGKELNKYGQLLPIASQVGHMQAFNYILAEMKSDLESWFTASPGETGNLFYYDPMGVLIGYEASFNTNTELNDMHFHYSYYVMAASMIARYDRQWATDWQEMVELLIRNCNAWDRNDSMFPFLRYFDPYEGHSWANGWALFGDGNNMESSSESVNFAAAMIQWGKEMCKDEILDLGMYLYHSEIAAAEQYWFDIDKDNFPSSYPKDYSAILWGSGGVYGTFWTDQPEEVRGINILPVTAYSLYLGRDRNYVNTFYNNLMNEDTYDFWRYVHWSYLSMGDASRALSEYNSFAPQVDNTEYGSTEAFTNYWLNLHNDYGEVQFSNSSNLTHSTVFNQSGQKTYIVYNPGCAAPKTVIFSDGMNLNVNSGEYKIVQDQLTNDIVVSEPTISIFPNPTTTMFYITGLSSENYSVRLFDASGRKLHEGQNQEMIEMDQLPNGLYFVELIGDFGTHRSSIVKK
jgi:endoglucanase Acf2